MKSIEAQIADKEHEHYIMADTIDRCQDVACRAVMVKWLQRIQNERAAILIEPYKHCKIDTIEDEIKGE